VSSNCTGSARSARGGARQQTLHGLEQADDAIPTWPAVLAYAGWLTMVAAWLITITAGASALLRRPTASVSAPERVLRGHRGRERALAHSSH